MNLTNSTRSIKEADFSSFHFGILHKIDGHLLKNAFETPFKIQLKTALSGLSILVG